MEVDATDFTTSTPVNFSYSYNNPASEIAPPPPGFKDEVDSSDYFDMDLSGVGGSSSKWQHNSENTGLQRVHVDERATMDRPFDLNERFVTILDQLDTTVEKLRKDALGLQEKRDYLLMSIDLIKNNELLTGMSEDQREEIHCYIQRVNARLATVELNVRTIRDNAQEDSLHQINVLIDSLISLRDPTMARQRCQTYLNACSGSDIHGFSGESFQASCIGGLPSDIAMVDKNFECALLGCTLDDQKNIKKRLQALMNYLNKQIVSD